MRKHQSATQPIEIAREALGTVRQAAQDLAHDIDLESARDNVRDTVASIDLESMRDTVRDTVTDETQARPVRSILIALGLGTVIGAVVTRRRKQKPARIEDWTPRS